MTDLGGAPRRAKPPGGRQTIVRVLRIACRTISVSLKDTGPRVAGSTEKDALRRSSTPGEYGVLGTCDCVGALKWENGPVIQGLFRNLQRRQQTDVIPGDRRGRKCRDLGNVVGRRHLDDIHSCEAEPGEPAQYGSGLPGREPSH